MNSYASPSGRHQTKPRLYRLSASRMAPCAAAEMLRRRAATCGIPTPFYSPQIQVQMQMQML